jgi:uncharacterized membrane protein
MIRSFIHLLSQHSNWKASSVRQTLDEEVYASPKNWHTMGRGLILSLGVGWLVSGIIFFFAFNWDQLHPFVKMGLMQIIFLLFALLAWKSRFSPLVNNILLTGAAVLVGVLFAVFGQIYQTGANAYDFFFSWWACLILWTIYLLFEPMWLLMVVLTNVTLAMYIEQETLAMQHSWEYLPFVLLNVFFYGLISWMSSKKQVLTAPWLRHIILLWISLVLMVGFGAGLYGKYHSSFLVFTVIMVICLLAGFWIGMRQKNIVLLVLVGLTGMIVVLLLMNQWFNNTFSFFLSGIWIVGSLSFLVSELVKIQKKWRDE